MSEASLGWRELTHYFTKPGKLEWIGVRETRREPLTAREQVEVLRGFGIAGDHKAKRQSGGARQVTLIQAEHLPVIAALMGRDTVDVELTRRNLVVSGINLLVLRDQRLRIGDAMFEGTGICPPCSRMEHALGAGALTAMRGHGGITASVQADGQIEIGDEVTFEPG